MSIFWSISYNTQLFVESDLIPGFAAFLGCLIFPLHIGVFVGIGVDLITIFYRSARPKILVHIFKVRIYEILIQKF